MKDELDTGIEQKCVYERMAGIAVKNFTSRNVNAQYVPDRKAALAAVMAMVSPGAVVGTADSVTLLQIGVLSELKKRGSNEIINPFTRNEQGFFVATEEQRAEKMRRVLQSDVYLIGTNAVTLDGKLVNVDSRGNRVAGMIFGPKKVVIVAGANKIVKNVDEALVKIREFSAPTNATRHAVKHNRADFLDLPCVKTGTCVDCRHAWRICHYTTIIEGEQAVRQGHLNVVLVGETLGI